LKNQAELSRHEIVKCLLDTTAVTIYLERVTEAKTFKLDELARAAGTSPRTVRYYVQRGLLAAPAFHGKDTAYGREHLVRLKAIRRLQEAYLPLDAIAVELERLTLAELERLADTGDGVPEPVAPPEPPRPRRPERVVGPKAHVVRRYEIAPGVTLEVGADAPADASALAEKILELAGRS
jgi:DNA-binding transcriptional MerR regulator